MKRNDACSIDGEAFSLRPASSEDSRYWDSRHWLVRSPSVSGWDRLASKIDLASQWKMFTRGLARMHEDGCFPSGLTALQIQVAIARRIPLPASEVPVFFYSDRGMGFADLTPGMEIRLEGFLPAAEANGARPQGPRRLWASSYDVIPRHGRGVELKLRGRSHRGAAGESKPEDKELLSLSQRFAQTAVLRLFLEGVYGTGPVSHGILIGASTQEQVDTLTERIYQSDPAKCVQYEGTVCTEFPLGAVSLFSTVWVNGRRTSCVFGSSLAALERCQPPMEQAVPLDSAQVLRRVQPNVDGEINFPRDRDAAAQLLLLPGDRIVWRR